MHMWSSCFSSFNSLEAAGAAHSLGSSCGASGSLPAPDTPILAATKAALGTPPSDVSAASSSRAASAAMAAAAAAPGAPAGDKGMPARASSSSSRSVSAGSEDACPSLADTDTHMDDPPHAAFGAEEHGEPDCELLGSGWRLAAHKRVLKSECCVVVLRAQMLAWCVGRGCAGGGGAGGCMRTLVALHWVRVSALPQLVLLPAHSVWYVVCCQAELRTSARA
jgi:hypothetical protein